MRIVAGLSVHEVGGNDDLAVRLRRRAQQLLHPGVVVGAVHDGDLRARDLPHDARRGLEQMRVLIGVVHDADDVDMGTPDLVRDIAIEILRCHHGDLAIGGACGRSRGERKENGEG